MKVFSKHIIIFTSLDLATGLFRNYTTVASGTISELLRTFSVACLTISALRRYR